RGIRGDREHERVELWRAAPIIRIGAVADQAVLLILDQDERTRPNRLLVDQLGMALRGHRLRVFQRQDGGEIERYVGEKGDVGVVEREADGEVVELVDRLDELA